MAVRGEVLAGIDLDLEPQRNHRWPLGLESVDQSDPALLDNTPGLPQPAIENIAEDIQRATDGLGVQLHQIDILGVALRRLQIQLVERCPTSPSQTRGDLLDIEDLHNNPAEDETLLDLLVRRPGHFVSPLGDEVSRNHRSTSTSMLMATRQRSDRLAPVRGIDASRGATRVACSRT